MKNLYEIFDEVNKRTERSDKIAVLRFNTSFALKSVLKGAFDPTVEFVFDKPVNYKPSDMPIGMGYSSIHQELSRAYLFEKNNSTVDPNLTQKRKEELLTQILESLEAREAELFQGMILKDLKVEGLTYDLVKEAFPDLLP